MCAMVLSGMVLRMQRKQKRREREGVGKMESSREEVAQNQLKSRARDSWKSESESGSR